MPDMVARTMSNKISCYGFSDPGLVRENNEDVWGSLPEANVFVLADGMGGHRAGEIASKEAVDALIDILKIFLLRGVERRVEEVAQIISQAILEVNHFIHQMARNSESLKGMGTTLCCLCFYGDYLIYAHVGDSRIYQLRKKKLIQLTQDHTLLQELIEMGQINKEEAERFHYKNILTRAIGTEPTVEPSIEYLKVEKGDIYMMCSDGLYDDVSFQEMEKILIENSSIQDSVDRLVKLARARGGHDNITVVATQV
jgi:protein phosphatase